MDLYGGVNGFCTNIVKQCYTHCGFVLTLLNSVLHMGRGSMDLY